MTLIVRSGFMFDEDASNYIEAVEDADEAASPGIGALEVNTRYAINDFVIGCKNDGIWNAIKASCILAGARTLEGALVPLVGAAPTNVDGLFVSGDYNRKIGLKGNSSTKYLDTNRAGNADPTNNRHISCFYSGENTNSYAAFLSAAVQAELGRNTIGQATGGRLFRAISGSLNDSGQNISVGFIGLSRSEPPGFVERMGKVNTSIVNSSATSSSNTYRVFRGNNPSAAEWPCNARIAFYSIGESLDLALLDVRVTNLINTFGAAIP